MFRDEEVGGSLVYPQLPAAQLTVLGERSLNTSRTHGLQATRQSLP